jgi:hypothetical protein
VIGAVVAMLLMLGLLTWQLAVLKDSRGHIAAQDAKITRLLRGSEPVLREARPAAEDAQRLLRASVPVVRSALPLIRGARPLVTALRALDTIRLDQVVNQSGALLEALARSGLLDRAVRAADLIPYIARIQELTLAVQRRSLDVQTDTRDIQVRAYRVLRRSLAIQREALVHVRSIDRKTGGQVPPVTPKP